jgi:hypothetical protein
MTDTLPTDAPQDAVDRMNDEVVAAIARLAKEPITVTAPEEDDPDVGLSREVRHLRWQAKRPVIAHLHPGVLPGPDGPVPMFDVGDRIVVDCMTDKLQGRPWLETIVGRVRSIDDDSGLVTIFDEDSDFKLPKIRYVSFKRELYTFKLAPKTGNPFEPPAVVKQPKLPPQEGKRSRGRPKGSVNRPKDVIRAEKEARKAAKRAK